MPYLPILTYHRLLVKEPMAIADPNRIVTSASLFRRHLTLLKRLGYRTLDLAEYPPMLRQGRKLPSRTFAIAFDDGYEEMLTLALPILREFGFSATVFALPGYLGGTNAWDDGQARLLTAKAMQELDRSGIRIESHASRHVHLTQVRADQARTDMSEAKSRLEEILGRRVSLLAYPYGESNEEVERIAEEVGYEAAFATDRAPRDHSANRYRLRRVVAFPRTTPWQALLKVQRWYPAYQDWMRRGK
jgi:peptidoglycan/xylan/chitin deacetylase (PgdA/CDA1 family)